MKQDLKRLFPAFIISFVISFMFIIYEPIVMYLNNISDFWFDIFSMLKFLLLAFPIALILIFVLYLIVYFIQKFLFKEKFNIYNILLLIGFAAFLILYIHGNFLAGSLPALDGKSIEWSNFTIQNVISILVVFVVTISIIITSLKFKTEKVINVLSKISLAVFLMLFISFSSVCISKKTSFVRKTFTVSATSNNINKYSSKKNLIVLLLDSIDSETMEGVIKNNHYKEVFNDFTYYPDTVGAYPFTRDTVPFVLSGVWSENKMPFADYYNYAMDNSKLLSYLRNDHYNINIYNNEISYNTEKSRDIRNFSFDDKLDFIKFLKQELKYDLFKYLPFSLKKYSRIETMDFVSTRLINSDSLFSWENEDFINNYLQQDVIVDNNYEFKFIHLEGAHYPFDVDGNSNKKDNGTYEDKIEASINLIDCYLKYLKDNNVYDNSAIIIFADHGFWYDTTDDGLLRRQNPILYIKGFNEKHKRNVSDEKVSFDNFQDIYRGLLDGKQTSDLFKNIDLTQPRRFLLYRIAGYDHMEEFLQYGHSKDFKTLKATGNKYDLEG